jgi:hypothetical protein
MRDAATGVSERAKEQIRVSPNSSAGLLTTMNDEI